MATLKVKTVEETDIAVTPDFCFQKAAECLFGMPSLNIAGGTEYAREWRLLGETLRGDAH